MTQRAHIFVTGRVQGVCYRAFTKENAVAAGLNGWVRNTDDGCVEAVFEGSKSEIERMISICRQGPTASLVRDIDVQWEGAAEGLKGFQIRY